MRKSKTTKPAGKSTRNARPWIVRARAWIAIIIIAPFAVIAALSTPMVHEHTVGDFVLDAIGWACFVAGASLRWWATLYLGGRKGRELASEGPYSLTRNPLYLGTFLMTLAIAFYIHSVLFFIGLIFATPIYMQVTVPWEEQTLRKTFGERFERYRQRTPVFFPSFRNFHASSTVEVDLHGVYAEFLRMLQWIWIPFLSQAFSEFRAEGWWSNWGHS